MMIIFGGRSSDPKISFNDTWGLRKHRDSTWDWIKAPYISNLPKPRFQSSIAL